MCRLTRLRASLQRWRIDLRCRLCFHLCRRPGNGAASGSPSTATPTMLLQLGCTESITMLWSPQNTCGAPFFRAGKLSFS